MSRAVCLAALSLVAMLSAQGQAMAQSAPGAGDMLRDLPPPAEKPAAAPAPELSEPAATAVAPMASFVLREVQLDGNTLMSRRDLAAIVAPYVGQKIDEPALSRLIGAVRQRYQALGYALVGVGYPDQDVSTGLLKLQVVEPRLGRVQVPTGEASPVTDARVQGLLRVHGLKAGELLNTTALERVMFALNDMPGVRARAALAPAGDEGVYNLTIETQATRAWDASVGVDNQGIGEAGRWRFTGLMRLNNPLGMGDNLDLQALLSNTSGVKVGRVAYELPVGYTPARLSVAYAKVAYALGGQFASYDAHGTARVTEGTLSYPFLRSRSRTLIGRVGIEHKALTDELDAFDVRSDKHIRNTVLGLSWESRDAWLGGGFNGASAQFRWGHLGFGTDQQRQDDAALGAQSTGGSFGKAEWQFSRLQAVTREVALYANLSQQIASRNLDAAEKMSLGGPRAVRAYPTAEAASDEATLFNSELRWWLNPNWTVFALYDWARGRQTRDPGASGEAGNDVVLRGAGFGLVANYPQWVTLKATLAWRGNRKPVTDTHDDKPRLYLQAQHTF